MDRFGNTSSGSIPLALADARADGRLRDGALVLMTGMGAGLTWGSALMEWTAHRLRRTCSLEDKGSDEQGRVLLPGTGLARGRHGPRDRRGRARGDGGLPRRLRGDRHRSRAALLRGAARGARRDGGAAADARRDEPRDPRRRAEGGHRARRRRRPLGRRVRRARLGRRDRHAARRSASSASVGWRWPRRRRQRPGAMAAILGLEDELVETPLPQDLRRLARELQLPRPDRRLRRERGGRGVLRRGREPRRPTSDPAQGLGRVPQPARRPSGRPAEAGDRPDPLRRAGRAVHVDRDGEDRAGPASRRRCSSIS